MKMLRTAVRELQKSAYDFEKIITNINSALLNPKNVRAYIKRNDGLAKNFSDNLVNFAVVFARLELFEIKQEAQQSNRRRPSQLLKSTRKRVATKTTQKKAVRRTTTKRK